MMGLQVWGWRFTGTLHNINVAPYNDSGIACLGIFRTFLAHVPPATRRAMIDLC